MFKFIRRLIFVLILIAVALFAAEQFWPKWWQKDFIPPWPAAHDCTVVQTEVDKYDWDKGIAMGIARAESGCDASAKGDTDLTYHQDGRDYGYSVGVFQIRILPGREACDSFNVAQNVKCAYDIYKDAGWGAWTMYTNGTYRKFMWRGLDQLF